MSTTQNALLEKLYEVSQLSVSTSEVQLEHTWSTLRDSLLQYGSQTPDNVRAMDQIELVKLQSYQGAPWRIGFKLRKSGIDVTNLLSICEVSTSPLEAQKQLSDLQPEEWEACFRLVILILSDLQGGHRKSPTI